MGFTVDLTTVKDIKDIPEDFGDMQPGYYLGTIEDVTDDTDGGTTLHIKPVANGLTIRYKFWNPDRSETEVKADKCRKLNIGIAKRLGVIKPDMAGKTVELDFFGLIGASVVMKISLEEDASRPGKMWPRCSFGDIFNLESGHIPPAERARLGLPELEEHRRAAEEAAKNGTAAGGSKKGRGKAKAPAADPAVETQQRSEAAAGIDVSDI